MLGFWNSVILQKKKIILLGETPGFLGDEEDRGAKTQLDDAVSFPGREDRVRERSSPSQPGQSRGRSSWKRFLGGFSLLPPLQKNGTSPRRGEVCNHHFKPLFSAGISVPTCQNASRILWADGSLLWWPKDVAE